MKISGKGVAILVVVLVLVPLLADYTLLITFGPKGLPNMGMSVVSAWYYLVLPPFISFTW